MHQAASAYARVAKAGQSGREIEASVLLNAAARLQAVCDRWDANQHLLGNALDYNKRVWTILATSATADENPLPVPVKQGVANLAMFTFKRTLEVMIQPAPEKLRAMISINREIAAGLRGSPAMPAGQAA